MMIDINDIKNGMTVIVEGNLYQIVDFLHVKPGKGAAFVRTKYKNLKSGVLREETFNPNDKFPKAVIDTKEMQYLYSDGELYYFMDNESFEQIPLNYDQVEDAIKWLKENDSATIRFYQGSAFQVEAPNFVELEVVECEPGVKGDTTTNVTKAATMETGAIVQVPLFVNQGDKIRIDTRSGDYMSRV